MFSLIIILLIIHWPYTSSISGGFRAKSQPSSTGIVLMDNVWNIVDPPFCAGALISNRIVLTNGLCCSNPPINRTRIILGSTTPFSSGQFYFIDDFRLIGMAGSAHYKLCVLRLDRVVSFTESVQPLTLPSKADAFVQGTQLLYSYGYGSVNLDKDKEQNPVFQRVLSSEMMAIFFPRLSIKTCEKFFGVQTLGNWKLLCMGFTMERKKRLMLDDNGAPLVGMYDRVVYGISSTYSELNSGYNWDTDSFPNYVIDVKSARDDISRAIRQMFE